MNAIAICSCPRLGFMDFMGRSLVAFAQNGIAYQNSYGVYWAEAMSNAIDDAIKEYDYIITTDYDSLYTGNDVKQLVELAKSSNADAICALQMGRFYGPLFATESGEVSCEEIKKDLLPISQGHFGLTIFKASTFKTFPKPWMASKPNENGEWKDGRIDADIDFWRNFKKAGKQLHLAPRIVIGHIETMVAWPDENLEAIYSKIGDYNRHGKPPYAWK